MPRTGEPQWKIERARLEKHRECLDEMNRLVELGEMDPAAPTHFKRGSWDRVVLMSVRNDMGLPLFVDGDCFEDDVEPADTSGKPRPVARCRLILQDSLERRSGGRVCFDGDANSQSHDH